MSITTGLTGRQKSLWLSTQACIPDAAIKTPRDQRLVDLHGLAWNAAEQNNGAGKEARTPDLNLGKVALYQLSYSRPKQTRNCRAVPPGVKKNPAQN